MSRFQDRKEESPPQDTKDSLRRYALQGRIAMSQQEMPYPVTLTIAGSDSGGGAGIQADLKTFTVLGAYGTSAITAITAQNTQGVTGVQEISPEMVREQIDAVMGDIGCSAAKTGMLANAEIVSTVAEAVAEWDIPNLVVDPVMVARSGDRLLADDAVETLLEELIPQAAVVTPNLPEAEALTGITIDTEEKILMAAEKLCETGCKAAVIKGGHMQGAANDYLYESTEGISVLEADRIDTENTHGTGCTFSASLAVWLARGIPLDQAVVVTKQFITMAIEQSLPLGSGHGPVDHIGGGEALVAYLNELAAEDT